MRITVTHSTLSSYDFPVFLEPHIFRLRPLTNSAQRLRVAAGAPSDTLSFLLALSRQTFQTCRQVIRPDGPPWPSHLTLTLLEGFCRGLAVSIGHVAVAAGFDHDLASPLVGWYSGGARSQMEASLNLQVDYAA